MIRIKDFFRNAGTVRSLQIFQLLRFASFFLTGILLAKGPVSTFTIGTYETIMFFSSAISFFWVSGILNGLLAKFELLNNEDRKKYLFNVSLLISTLNFLVIGSLWIGTHLFSGFNNSGIDNYLPLVFIYILLNNPGFINEYILLLKGRSFALMLYGVSGFILTVLAVILPLWMGYDLSAGIKGLIFISILKIILLGVLLNKYADAKIDINIWKSHLSYSLPLIISILISGSADYIDGLLVSSHFGKEEFAIFRYGARELPLALILANAMSSAFIPRLTLRENFNTETNELKKESGKLMHLLFPVSILLVLFSQLLYPVFFRKEFAGSAGIFNIYLLLVISRVLFPQTITLALQKKITVLKIAVAEVTINIVMSYFLMLHFGIKGVAWGTLIAFFSEKILLMMALYFNEGISPQKYSPLKLWITYTIMLVTAYLFVENFV